MSTPIKLSQVEVKMHLRGSFLCYGSGTVGNPTGYAGVPFQWQMHQDRSIMIQFDPVHTILTEQRGVLDRVAEVEQELRLQLTVIIKRLMP